MVCIDELEDRVDVGFGDLARGSERQGDRLAELVL